MGMTFLVIEAKVIVMVYVHDASAHEKMVDTAVWYRCIRVYALKDDFGRIWEGIIRTDAPNVVWADPDHMAIRPY
ncbi:hypothetical protein Tco_0687432, partial [Tanacetum coccineum]